MDVLLKNQMQKWLAASLLNHICESNDSYGDCPFSAIGMCPFEPDKKLCARGGSTCAWVNKLEGLVEAGIYTADELYKNNQTGQDVSRAEEDDDDD